MTTLFGLLAKKSVKTHEIKVKVLKFLSRKKVVSALNKKSLPYEEHVFQKSLLLIDLQYKGFVFYFGSLF